MQNAFFLRSSNVNLRMYDLKFQPEHGTHILLSNKKSIKINFKVLFLYKFEIGIQKVFMILNEKTFFHRHILLLQQFH